MNISLSLYLPLSLSLYIYIYYIMSCHVMSCHVILLYYIILHYYMILQRQGDLLFSVSPELTSPVAHDQFFSLSLVVAAVTERGAAEPRARRGAARARGVVRQRRLLIL